MDKKTLIFNNAIKLFYEKGFFNTTVQEIVNSCNISIGTFYNCFDDKSYLLYTIVDKFVIEFADFIKIISNINLKPFSKLKLVLKYLIDYTNDNVEIMGIINSTLYYIKFNDQLPNPLFNEAITARLVTSMNKIIDMISKIITECQLEGIVKPYSPILIMKLFMNLILGFTDINSKSRFLPLSNDFESIVLDSIILHKQNDCT